MSDLIFDVINYCLKLRYCKICVLW